MLPIAALAAVTGVAVLAAKAAGLVDLPYWVPAMTLAGAVIAGFAQGRATMVRSIIAFLVVWHVASVAVLVANVSGAFPESWAPYLPTRASVLLSIFFAGIMLAVSFVGVIKQITVIADPFFETRDRGVIELPFGIRFAVQERFVAHGILYLLLAINIAQVMFTVLLNEWNGRFYTALQQRDEPTFWIELRFWFAIVFVFIISIVYEIYITQYYKMRWRRWLTDHLTALWLKDGAHFRMRLTGSVADNPDQRIAEDIEKFCERTISFTIRFFASILSLYAFVLILWALSARFPYTVSVSGMSFDLGAVPGYLVWAALGFAIVGTVFAHLIGRPLIRINYDRQRFEADYRYSLVRVRENDEQIALLKGERAESQGLGRRFQAIVTNWFDYMKHTKRLTWFTSFLNQFSSIFPIIILAPAYFSGAVQFGALTQTAGAFARVENALSLFVDLYNQLAEYKSVLDRLTGFSIAAAQAQVDPTPAIGLAETGNSLSVTDLAVTLPQGTPIVTAPTLSIQPGEKVLVTGPSGSGKSTLFRALAGIWPHGSGGITVPAGANPMLLPQRPYFPVGTLRDAITYPAERGTYPDEAIREALEAVNLRGLADRLDEEQSWHMILSGGEQQRVALVRALLAKPDWLFLDEATAAIDEAGEASLYQLLAARLPGSTVVSIGHRSTLVNFHDRRIHIAKPETGPAVAADAPLIVLARA